MDENTDLVERLNTLLTSGRFPVQSRLPSERQLATELKTTRAKLRQALALMEAKGLIWRHVGQGTFVGRPPVVDAPALTLLTKSTNPTEIMEARLILEPKIAGLAALRATADDIAQLERCVEKAAAARDLESFELWDGTFHETVAAASHSVLLKSLQNVMTELRADKLWGQLKKASVNQERRKAYNVQHQRCVDAIGNRDIAGAEESMRDHLETIHRHLFGSIDANY
ncbi:MAG: FadR family transcriptional regulator [Rhodospirillales bacterium]|nr:FadR family transcriptional regulator [Rhodospirillales bacterium]